MKIKIEKEDILFSQDSDPISAKLSDVLYKDVFSMIKKNVITFHSGGKVYDIFPADVAEDLVRKHSEAEEKFLNEEFEDTATDEEIDELIEKWITTHFTPVVEEFEGVEFEVKERYV